MTWDPTIWYVRPAKAQTSLRIRADWSEPLLVARIFYDYKATGRTSFGDSVLKRRLHRLIWVYTCQNATLLEITCHGSNSHHINSAYWVIWHAFCLLLIFFKINFFKKLFSGILSECRTVWIQIRHGINSSNAVEGVEWKAILRENCLRSHCCHFIQNYIYAYVHNVYIV